MLSLFLFLCFVLDIFLFYKIEVIIKIVMEILEQPNPGGIIGCCVPGGGWPLYVMYSVGMLRPKGVPFSR